MVFLLRQSGVLCGANPPRVGRDRETVIGGDSFPDGGPRDDRISTTTRSDNHE